MQQNNSQLQQYLKPNYSRTSLPCECDFFCQPVSEFTAGEYPSEYATLPQHFIPQTLVNSKNKTIF